MGGVLGPFLRPLGPGGYQPQTLSLQPILSRAPHEHSETSIGNQRITCSYGDWKWMNIVRLGEIRTSLGLDFQATNSDTNSGHPVSNITFCFCKDFGFGRLGPYVFSFQMGWWSKMFFKFFVGPLVAKQHTSAALRSLTALRITKQHVFIASTLISSSAMGSHYPLLLLWRSQLV